MDARTGCRCADQKASVPFARTKGKKDLIFFWLLNTVDPRALSGFQFFAERMQRDGVKRHLSALLFLIAGTDFTKQLVQALCFSLQIQPAEERLQPCCGMILSDMRGMRD